MNAPRLLRLARAFAFVAAGFATPISAMSCTPKVNDTDAGSAQLNEAGLCSTSVEGVLAAARSPQPGPACPARFDDVRDRGPCEGFTAFRSGPCGSALVYRGGCGLDNFLCVYDATSRQLVGAATSTDLYQYCGGSSNCLVGGTLPEGFTCTFTGLGAACQDTPLGADASTTTDADASLDAQPGGG